MISRKLRVILQYCPAILTILSFRHESNTSMVTQNQDCKYESLSVMNKNKHILDEIHVNEKIAIPNGQIINLP